MHALGRLVVLIATLALLLVVPAGAAVADSVQVDRQGLVRVYTNTCSGEQVVLQGTYNLVIKQNNDGTSTWIIAIHATGTTTSGNEYVLEETRTSVFDSTGGFELKGDSIAVLVSKGEAPNQLVWFHFDFTVFPPVVSLDFLCTG